MKKNPCWIIVLLLSSLFIHGCSTINTTTMYIPEGRKTWPTEIIQITDQITITNSYAYGYRKEKSYDGEKGLSPYKFTTLSMPSGQWQFRQLIENNVIDKTFLEKFPTWWHDNYTKSTEQGSFSENHFLIPGLGLVKARKLDYKTNEFSTNSVIFYDEVQLLIDQNTSTVDPKKSGIYQGIIIPDQKDPSIASRAILIPGNTYAPKVPVTDALILSKTENKRLALIPLYDSSHKKVFYEFVDESIHFMSLGGNNVHNCQSHWLNKDGELITKENIFFNPKYTPDWNAAYRKPFQLYYYTADGGIASCFPPPEARDPSLHQKKYMKKITGKATPIYFKGEYDGDYMDGVLMGFIIEKSEAEDNGARFGWRDIKFTSWTGFIWDEITSEPITGPEIRQKIMLAHEPGKGWKAHKFGFPNSTYAFNGDPKGPEGRLAVQAHAEEQALQEWKQKDDEREYSIRKNFERDAKLAKEAKEAKAYLDSIGKQNPNASGYNSNSQSWNNYKDDAEARRKAAQQAQRERDMKNKIFHDKSYYE